MKTMDHATALRKAIAESYVLGELSEEERAEFEEHFFTCPECAEDVKALSTFVADARVALAARPVARRPVDAARRMRLLMLPLAATAVLSLGALVYQAVVTLPRLRSDLAQSRALQATSLHFLRVARSEPTEIHIGAQQRMIGLTLSLTGYASPVRYRVEVRDAEDRRVLSDDVAAPAAGDELQLLLPVSDLKAGAYTVELSGIDSPGRRATKADVVRYPFLLIREDK